MDVLVHIDDNKGQTYHGWFGSDSKEFAQLLIHTSFWEVLGNVFQAPTQPLTYIVAEQVVPNTFKHIYQSWEAYKASRFQPIKPLINSLEAVQLL